MDMKVLNKLIKSFGKCNIFPQSFEKLNEPFQTPFAEMLLDGL